MVLKNRYFKPTFLALKTERIGLHGVELGNIMYWYSLHLFLPSFVNSFLPYRPFEFFFRYKNRGTWLRVYLRIAFCLEKERKYDEEENDLRKIVKGEKGDCGPPT